MFCLHILLIDLCTKALSIITNEVNILFIALPNIPFECTRIAINFPAKSAVLPILHIHFWFWFCTISTLRGLIWLNDCPIQLIVFFKKLHIKLFVDTRILYIIIIIHYPLLSFPLIINC